MNPQNPQVGDVFGPHKLEAITRTDIVVYQGASGDFEPIHHDEPFARSAGYDAPLVVGMLPAGMLTTWAAELFGPEHVRRSRIRWKSQVWPGDELTCSGQVTARYEEAGEARVDVALECQKSDGAVAVAGWMTFVLS